MSPTEPDGIVIRLAEVRAKLHKRASALGLRGAALPAPEISRPAHEPDSCRFPPERQRHLHRFFLVRLQGDLLGEHDVACGEAALGHEAPAADAPSLLVELEDVLLSALQDAVAPAGLGADDFEVPFPVELGELLGGEPFPEEDPGFGFGVEALSRTDRPGSASGDAA